MLRAWLGLCWTSVEVREVVVRLQRMAEALIILGKIDARAKSMCTLQHQSLAIVQSRSCVKMLVISYW